jgi:hypothetical protein
VRAIHALAGGIGKLDWGSTYGDGDDVVEGQRLSVE